MSNELSILALNGLLVLATILVQVLLALPQLGLPYLAGPRDEGRRPTGMAARALRAVDNSVIAIALFAPAVLILAAKEGGFTATTLLAAQVYLAARVIYVPLYLFGVPYLRTLVWTVGFMATVMLYFAAI